MPQLTRKWEWLPQLPFKTQPHCKKMYARFMTNSFQCGEEIFHPIENVAKQCTIFLSKLKSEEEQMRKDLESRKAHVATVLLDIRKEFVVNWVVFDRVCSNISFHIYRILGLG